MRCRWAPILLTAGCVASGPAATIDTSSSSSGPTDDLDCELGVIAGPTQLDEALGELPGSLFGNLGLLATPAGLLAVFSSTGAGVDEQSAPAFAVRLDHERTPLSAAVPIDPLVSGVRWSAGPELMLRTQCRDFILGWSLLDASGVTVAALPPPVGFGCAGTPAVAWLGPTRFLAAWLSFHGGDPANTGCPDPGSCLALALVEDGAITMARPLWDDGANGPTPSVAMAASADAVVVAQLRWFQSESTNEIVAMLVDHGGTSLAPEAIIAMPESTSDHRFLSLGAVAQSDGSFAIYLGGYGSSMARARIDADGAVIEPFTSLPLFHEVGVFAVYERDFGVFPWNDGAIAYGSAADGGLTNGLLTGLDGTGARMGHVELEGLSRTLAGVGTRAWLLQDYYGGRLHLSELGCVDAGGR